MRHLQPEIAPRRVAGWRKSTASLMSSKHRAQETVPLQYHRVENDDTWKRDVVTDKGRRKYVGGDGKSEGGYLERLSVCVDIHSQSDGKCEDPPSPSYFFD